MLFEIPLESGRWTRRYFRHLTRIYNHVNIDSLDLLHDSKSRIYSSQDALYDILIRSQNILSIIAPPHSLLMQSKTLNMAR